jgi:RND superfamily putative drug exporter
LLESEVSNPDSPWRNSQVATAGTTVGITDLRFITQTDQRRIQILVTIGVWLVLVVMLRQWVLSTYLIATVMLSYFSTLGVTYWTFSALYGADYSGLDWKVPLFLFVILVAVGQDYNVYLVTRIFEESRALGLRAGVRQALEVTGGIISSCGCVMAGTFIAMTSPAVMLWLGDVLPAGWVDVQAPVLRGITELGFALAFGVLLDTLVVRSILVPAFVVLWQPSVRGTHRGLDAPAASR